MKVRYAVFLFAVTFVVQSTLLRYIAVWDTAPNLLLCMVIVFAFLYETPLGLALGAVFGLLWDIVFGLYAGVSAVSFMCAALAQNGLKTYLNHELVLPAALGALLGSVLNNAVYWGIYKLLGAPQSLPYILKAQPVLIACNLVCVVLIHILLRRGVIRHRKDRSYKGGFREARGLKL